VGSPRAAIVEHGTHKFCETAQKKVELAEQFELVVKNEIETPGKEDQKRGFLPPGQPSFIN